MRKQIETCMQRLENQERTEKSLKFSQRAIKMHEKTIKGQSKLVTQLRCQIEKQKVVESKLREKLEEVMRRQEEEKELVMLVTK